jgi:carbonic anhydrase
MKSGNERYREEFGASGGELDAQPTRAGGYPAVALLSCLDSQISAENVLDLETGDLHACRIAGNVENADILRSLELACDQAGAKVVLVMGHKGCSAIKTAIETPDGPVSGWRARARSAVNATGHTGERTAENSDFVSAVARRNVELTLERIRRHSPILARLEASGAVRLAGAMYDPDTGAVEFFQPK